ncbi:MAG: MDR/zinc-dependent alcohol dehydrogenase-like family protein [Candidatus Alkanophagales archaeon]
MELTLGAEERGERTLKINEGDIIICAGGGAFGTRAVRLAKSRGARVLVLDVDENCEAVRQRLCSSLHRDVARCGLPEGGDAALIVGDAVETLLRILDVLREPPSVVVPAIQGHFFGRFVRAWLERRGIRVRAAGERLKNVLCGIPGRLVLRCDERNAVVVTSYMPAGKVCREGCGQPEVCPVTGLRKPAPMFRLLEFALDACGFEGFVLRSELFEGGGVGGVRGEAVARMLDALRRLETKVRDSEAVFVAVATSCSCHGILNLFSLERWEGER